MSLHVLMLAISRPCSVIEFTLKPNVWAQIKLLLIEAFDLSDKFLATTASDNLA